MTDKFADETALDAAIDRAVRDLMHVDPPADLRDRVLAEISGGSTTRAVFWPRLGFAAVAVIAAMAIGLTILNRPAPAPVTRISDAGPSTPETVARVPADPPARTPGTATPIPPDRRPRTRGNTARVEEPTRSAPIEDRPVQAASIDTAGALGVDVIGLEPMTPVTRLQAHERITVAPLETAHFAPLPLSLPPITIERMENSPLTDR